MTNSITKRYPECRAGAEAQRFNIVEISKKGKGEMKKFVCGIFIVAVLLNGCASPEEKPGEGGVSFGGGYKDAFLGKTNTGSGASYQTGYVLGYTIALPVNLVRSSCAVAFCTTGAAIVFPFGVLFAPRHGWHSTCEALASGTDWGYYYLSGYQSLGLYDNLEEPDDTESDHGLLYFTVKLATLGLYGYIDAAATRGSPTAKIAQTVLNTPGSQTPVTSSTSNFESTSPESISSSISDVTPNVYGPGIGQDQYGRPVQYEVPNWPKNEPTSTLQVTPNVYGPGMGQDQYGRPVKTKSAF